MYSKESIENITLHFEKKQKQKFDRILMYLRYIMKVERRGEMKPREK